MKTWQKNFSHPVARVREHLADKPLLITVGLLLVFGLIMLSSASSVISYSKFGDSYHFLKHQIFFGVIPGLVLFWIFSKIDYHFWKKLALPALIFSIFLLVLVFVPAFQIEGATARSWIKIGPIPLFQPAEFVKIFFLIYLSAWLESRQGKLHDLEQGALPFFSILGIIIVLMFLQPDLGTLMIIVATSFVVYFAGGGKIKHLIIIIAVGLLLALGILQRESYQQNRFRCFLDSDFSTNEICYQLNQANIAIGSGGFFGRGLGESRQKFLYLPEVYGDSIFAVIGEELGFLFCSALVIAFLYVFYRGFLIAERAPDIFGKMLAIGIVTWIFIQAFVNIGGLLNIIPMTGVPLPFISQGGSAIIASLIGIGILVNVSKQTKKI
jgi:cell division protein FtsW